MGFSLIRPILCSLAVLALGQEPAHAANQYSIHGLRAEGISQYGVPQRNAQREFIRFKNDFGQHYFIYEESPRSPPLSGVSNLRSVMGNPQMVCEVEVSCQKAAFCTGICRNMYYEMSNTPSDPTLANRNQCTVTAFKCKSGLEGGST